MDNLNYYVYDGLKATNLENVPEAWVSSGGDQPNNKIRQTVAWLLRAESLRTGAVSNMPFAIYKGRREITNSQDYEDKLGWLPNPRWLFGMIESALCNYGCAYFWRAKNVAGVVKGLKYFLPPSIEPAIDPVDGLTGFTRRTNSREYKYAPDEILYFWPPDGAVEIGPPTVWPLQSALSAAKGLDAVNDFVERFINQGLVKATLLGVPRTTQQSERDRVETWFQRFLGGMRNSHTVKTINSDDVKPVVIGDGLEGLTDTTLTREAKEDIAAAYGIPFAIFFSDAANYATAAQDWRQWYETSIIPEVEFIAATINEQILFPTGYSLEFHPETLDFFQDDENERSTSLSALVNAGVPLLTAMDILGFELTDEQRAAIEAGAAEKERRAAEMAERMRQAQVQPVQEAQPQTDDDQDDEPEAKSDLRKWERKATKAIKRGASPAVDFTSDSIPQDWQDVIVAGLPGCQSVEDVRNLFGQYIQTSIPTGGAIDYTALLAEMKRTNDLLERSLEQP